VTAPSTPPPPTPSPDWTHVAPAVAEVQERIAVAVRRAGRSDQVTLVAASKTVPVAGILAAQAAGVRVFGENRAQELLAKAPALVAALLAARAGPAGPDAVAWHFLGRLQRNKVRGLAPWVACWQSVDRLALGEELARRVPGTRVLVEVNLAQEPQKGGCPPDEVEALIARLTGGGLEVDVTVEPGQSVCERHPSILASVRDVFVPWLTPEAQRRARTRCQ